MFKKYLIIFSVLILTTVSFSAQRLPLGEVFTSSTCGPCATAWNQLNPYWPSHLDDMIMVAYHVWWPAPGNDPMYAFNSSESAARVNYYGVNAAPSMFDNGTQDGSSFSSWGPNLVASGSNSSPLSIEITGYYDDYWKTGQVEVAILPELIVSNTVLHVVLIEMDIHYTGTNGDPIHNFVMRDMIPNASGTSVSLTTGITTTINLDFDVPDVVDDTNAKIVAFVQNVNTKQVYNAAVISVSSIVLDCPNLAGDVGGDGAVTVEDLVRLVNIILGQGEPPENCEIDGSDVNNDSEVNILDLVQIVDIILGT